MRGYLGRVSEGGRRKGGRGSGELVRQDGGEDAAAEAGEGVGQVIVLGDGMVVGHRHDGDGRWSTLGGRMDGSCERGPDEACPGEGQDSELERAATRRWTAEASGEGTGAEAGPAVSWEMRAHRE